MKLGIPINPPLKVLVDNMSTDGTAAVASEAAAGCGVALTVVEYGGPGRRGGALAAGAAAARGHYLFFLHGDCAPPVGCVRGLLSTLRGVANLPRRLSLTPPPSCPGKVRRPSPAGAGRGGAGGARAAAPAAASEEWYCSAASIGITTHRIKLGFRRGIFTGAIGP